MWQILYHQVIEAEVLILRAWNPPVEYLDIDALVDHISNEAALRKQVKDRRFVDQRIDDEQRGTVLDRYLAGRSDR